MVRLALVKMPGLSPEDAAGRSERWRSILRQPPGTDGARLATRLWDLISWNEESLVSDFARRQADSAEKPAGPYHMVNDEWVWIGPGARVQPGAVLDASKGPVIIDAGATIGANAVLQGPCYVGASAQITPTALIRPGTSIGAVSKVGGEVSNSVIFGYSNKAHEGFLGDSYVGKWVNLGAGTITSNLKNTYGTITARAAEGEVKSGRRFLGSIIGDHAKTGIGTRLTCGAYVGFCAMIAASGIAPKFTPSFSFITDAGQQPYRADKAVEVIGTVFARRDRAMDEVDREIIAYAAAAAPKVESGG